MCLLIPAPWVIVIQLSEIIQWIAIGNNKELNVRQEKGTQNIAQPGLLPFPPLAAVWQGSETRSLIQITTPGTCWDVIHTYPRLLQGVAKGRLLVALQVSDVSPLQKAGFYCACLGAAVELLLVRGSQCPHTLGQPKGGCSFSGTP